MPLTGTGDALGDAIRAAIDLLPESDRKDRDKVFRKIGDAIIAHLTGPAGVNAVAVSGSNGTLV